MEDQGRRHGHGIPPATVCGQANIAITTIEAVAENGTYSPLQQALHKEHGVQCGFLHADVLTFEAYLRETPGPLEDQVREDNVGKPLPPHRLPECRQGDP